MKTPITYYGGKQSMLKHILPLIPPHKIYVEPFVGGGAVFWAKEPADVEVINDTNSEVINFYQVAKKQYRALAREINAVLHSREMHRQAAIVYKYPEMFSPVKRAGAFWVPSCQSFSASLGCGWRHAKSLKIIRTFESRRRAFTKSIKDRLEKTQIECNNALRVIDTWDDTETFFYLDPPYFNANMGHYSGYTLQDFTSLLETLSRVKGKFLLSSYPSEILTVYIKRFGWKTVIVNRKLGMRKEGKREKTEVLTANYQIVIP